MEAPSTLRVSRNTVAPPIEAVVFTDKSASVTTLLWKVATSTTSNVLFNVEAPSTRRVSRNTVAPPIEAVVFTDKSASATTWLWKVATSTTSNVLFNVDAPATDKPWFIDTSPESFIIMRSIASLETVLPAGAV